MEQFKLFSVYKLAPQCELAEAIHAEQLALEYTFHDYHNVNKG